jgi:diguanylate cyclase (GGDEF)-like protein
VPVVASGEVLGSLSFCLGRKPIEGRTTTLRDEAQQFKDNSDEVKQETTGIEYLSIMGESVAIALANIRLREALRDQAVHDKLTGLFNRRFMDEVLDLELSRAERNKASLAVVMLDVDHFKKFNDRYGHDAGDAVLAALGGCLSRQARKSDICCRYGGEEFLVVLPDADAAGAASWAGTLRQEVENMVLSHQGQQLGPVTVSCGVASYPLNANNKTELVKAADEALYRSKVDGRNRVTAAARSAHLLP